MKRTKVVYSLFLAIMIIVFACSCSTTVSDFGLGAASTIPLSSPQTSTLSVAPSFKFSGYVEDDASHTIHFYDYGFVTPVFSNGFSGINLYNAVGVAFDFDFKNSQLMIGPALSFSGTLFFNPITFDGGWKLALFSDYKFFFNDKFFLNAQLELTDQNFIDLGAEYQKPLPIVKAFIGVGIRTTI